MRPVVIQIERTKERTAETCAFAQSPVRIGRNPLNDVELDDGYVSQWHGVLRFNETHTTYLDLGSTNPTLVDGKPIARNMEVPISEATDLRIGSFRLHVFRVEEAPAELFGARRKTAFARTGVGDAGSVAATMFFGGEPTQLRPKSAVHALLNAAMDQGAGGHAPSSAPPPPSPPPPRSHPPGATSSSSSAQPLRSGQPPRSAAPPALPQRSAAPPALPQRSAPPPAPQRSAPPRASISVAPVAVTGAHGNSGGSAAPPPVAIVRSNTGGSPSPRFETPGVRAGSPEDLLRQAYGGYRQNWRALLAQLRARLEHAPSSQRTELLDALVQEFPEIGHETDFRTLISELGLSPLRTGVPEMEDWLRRLTENMFPPPNVAINLALAMERIGEVLEVFSTAFVELRDAHGRFCDEMSLERPPNDSILQTTKNPRLALAYLLNPSAEGSSKVEELARSMADFALHQVALVSAVVEGARHMLQELSPEAVSSQKSKGKAARPGLFTRMLSNEGKLHWHRYRGVFAEMVDEDRFTRRLFGRPFARKYYAIMGGRRSFTPSRSS